MDKEHTQSQAKSIRLYKTGQRTIIEIDGAGEDFDQAALRFLSAFLEKPVHAETLGLDPIDQELSEPPDRAEYLEELVMKDGPYAGMTAKQALHKDGERALVGLYDYAKAVQDPDEKISVCTACKRYMGTVLKEKRVTVSEEEEMDEFIRTVAPLVDIRRMLQMFTYRSLDEFLDAADYEEKHLAFDGLIESLILRGTQ